MKSVYRPTRSCGRVRPVLAVLGLVAGFVGAAPSAGANFASAASGNCYYSDERECYADGYIHNWYADLGPRMGAQVLSTLYGSYDTTDLTISSSGSHTTSVDVYFYNDEIPDPYPGWEIIGLSSCQTWAGHECDHWHVKFDGAQVAGYSDSELKALACHETGHTVGLEHPNVESHGWPLLDPRFGCLLDANHPISTLGTHNVGHINGHY